MMKRLLGIWGMVGVAAALGGCNADGDESAAGSASTTAEDTTLGTTSTPTTGDTPASGSTGDETTAAPTTDGSTGQPAICGDGIVDAGEACDDGNAMDGDGCSNMCTVDVCGDGTVQDGESCDDGNQADGDGCSSACVAEVCGDGAKQPAEECDDGNQADGDGCSSTCTLEACGDGILQGGEECDDGNAADGDGCSPMCTLEVCGDGVMQGEEQCDDGNVDDSDACTSACSPAACGDNFVYAGVEECDDGNMTADDGCSNTCTLPTCADDVKNAAETDVDCGGPDCDPCAAGQACGEDADCLGLCAKGVCASNKSCKTLHDADPSLPDGMYSLDPDEGGPNPPFMARCDMTHDGGGWTLIMKAIDANYHYDDPLWENTMTDNPDDYDFATMGKKSKYAGFMMVGFTALRTSYVDGSASYIHNLQAPVASATALFVGPGVEISKTMLLPYFEGIHAPYYKHLAGCNPSTKYVNHGINLKKINGVAFLADSNLCDWNGGARFGMRVNANHGGTGDHDGQGWGTYTTVNADQLSLMTQLLWVR